MSTNEPQSSFLQTIRELSALEAAAELAELSLDSFTTDEFIRDIPFVRTGFALARLAGSLRNASLARKITRFLTPLAEIPQKERERFAKRIEDDERGQARITETIVLVLDRLDDDHKPKYISKVFLAYLRSSINYVDMRQMMLVVDRCMMMDLGFLTGADKSAVYPPEIATRLMSCGVLQLRVPPVVLANGRETPARYELTRMGRRLTRVLTDE